MRAVVLFAAGPHFCAGIEVAGPGDGPRLLAGEMMTCNFARTHAAQLLAPLTRSHPLSQSHQRSEKLGTRGYGDCHSGM
jgi:enoyl-CoA hydratase/carnithine racemase